MSKYPKPEECRGCPEYANGAGFVPPDPIHKGTQVIFWGERPGADEDATGRGYVGPSGKKMRAVANAAGVTMAWVKRTGEITLPRGKERGACRNIVLCKGVGNKYPREEVALECLKRHQPEVLQMYAGAPSCYSPIPSVACGGNAIQGLTGYSGFKVTQIRGSVLPTRAGWCIATLHPAYLVRGGGKGSEKGKAQDDLFPLMVADVRKAVECCEPKIPTIYVHPSPRSLLSAFKEQTEGHGKVYVEIDIEGDAVTPKIVGLAWRLGEGHTLQWGPGVVEALREIVGYSWVIPVFHNAAYDVPELRDLGVPVDEPWVDTINLAALVNPTVKKALEIQTMTLVKGAVAWKGLIDHKKGYEVDTKETLLYKKMWTTVLRRLNRRVPSTPMEWFLFYNGLDVAWGLELMYEQKKALKSEGRDRYYAEVMGPIQKPLLEEGLGGLPVNVERRAQLKKACSRLERMAQKTLNRVGAATMKELYPVEELAKEAMMHEKARAAEGGKGYSGAAALAKVRSKLRSSREKRAEGFNAGSSVQTRHLLYTHFQLPPQKDRKTKGLTTNETACNRLLARLTKVDENGNPAPTLKVKKGVNLEDVIAALRAMNAKRKWGTWRRNFLTVPLKSAPSEGRRPRMPTTYSQHRASTGRLASGSDDTEGEKKRKVQQLQNVPSRIRSMVQADPGMRMIGADWAGIQWALVIYYASLIPKSFIKTWSPGPDAPAWYKEGSNRDLTVSRYLNGYFDNLLERFWRGEVDPHRYLAAFAFSVPEDEVTKEQRQKCKPYTHGYDFDGHPTTLARESGHTDAVGRKVCRGHDSAFMTQLWKDYEGSLVNEKGYIQTPLGWRRYYWEWKPKPTDYLAEKIQASEACLLKWVKGVSRRTQPSWMESLTTTHDSFLWQAPVDKVEEGKVWAVEQLQQEIPWLGGRRWRADVNVGETWRDV